MLVCDRYQAYHTVLDPKRGPERIASACQAHAHRKFDELLKARASAMAEEAVRSIAAICRSERALASLELDERLAMRQARALPIWEELQKWLQLERRRMPRGGAQSDDTLRVAGSGSPVVPMDASGAGPINIGAGVTRERCVQQTTVPYSWLRCLP